MVEVTHWNFSCTHTFSTWNATSPGSSALANLSWPRMTRMSSVFALLQKYKLNGEP